MGLGRRPGTPLPSRLRRPGPPAAIPRTACHGPHHRDDRAHPAAHRLRACLYRRGRSSSPCRPFPNTARCPGKTPTRRYRRPSPKHPSATRASSRCGSARETASPHGVMADAVGAVPAGVAPRMLEDVNQVRDGPGCRAIEPDRGPAHRRTPEDRSPTSGSAGPQDTVHWPECALGRGRFGAGSPRRQEPRMAAARRGLPGLVTMSNAVCSLYSAAKQPSIPAQFANSRNSASSCRIAITSSRGVQLEIRVMSWSMAHSAE